MIGSLLIGLPGERPGGLILTIIYFVTAGSCAFIAGFIYAILCTRFLRGSLLLQAFSALLRGTPLLLLVFLLAHIRGLSAGSAGFLSLFFYSTSIVGEILRPFLASYPDLLSQQASVMGIGPIHRWLELQVPWAFWKAYPALLTHWISLLKDTGVLIVLGIAELTTVAKVLSGLQRTTGQWAFVLVIAAGLYLGASVILIYVLQFGLEKFHPVLRTSSSQKIST